MSRDGGGYEDFVAMSDNVMIFQIAILICRTIIYCICTYSPFNTKIKIL